MAGLLWPVVDERSGTASPAWPVLQRPLDCPCPGGVPLESCAAPSHWGGVGLGTSQALTVMGSGLSGLWTLLGFT